MTRRSGAGRRPVMLFDLDDTLLDHRGAVEAAVRAVLRRIGADPAGDAAAAERWHALEETHYHRYLAGELDMAGQRRARARAFAADYGIELVDDAAASAWFEEYWHDYRDGWRLHDDAERCLDALADRRIGAITNGDAVLQGAKVTAVGLEARLEHVVASGSLGIAKPDPRIFAAACDLFGVSALEAVYVGDRLATDALGAAAAGLLGVWIDRRGIATDAEREAAAVAGVPVIRTLDALPPLLA